MRSSVFSLSAAVCIGQLVRLVALALPMASATCQELDVTEWFIREDARFSAPEAQQGVAVDAEFLYVIGDREIGKYDKQTQVRIAGWEGPQEGPILHFNSGIVHKGQLVLAHSNYPQVPMTGSVEWFDTQTLAPVRTHSLGAYLGSVTWVLPHQDGWLVCFAHYGNRAAEPNRDPPWTNLVLFDDQWRRTAGWVFPGELFEQIGGQYSLSGGAFGPQGLLYASGHDAKELYVLQFPSQGSQMKWIGTIPMPAEGQAFAWDPAEPNRFFGVVTRTREVVVGRLITSAAER